MVKSPESDGSPPEQRQRGLSPYAQYEQAVAIYTEAGGQETVQRVVTGISRVDRALDLFYKQQLLQLGLSHGEWTILSALALEGRDGWMMPSRLADLSGVTPSAMTHRLDRMSDRGLITRTLDPLNRSRTLIQLTAEGWEMFRRAVVEANVVESRILEPLSTDERQTLAELLERVLAGLRSG